MVDRGDHSRRAHNRCSADNAKEVSRSFQRGQHTGQMGPQGLAQKAQSHSDWDQGRLGNARGPNPYVLLADLRRDQGIPAQTTGSLNRRWRAACNLFSHRSFTNDPVKVAAWRNLGR